MYKIEKPDEYSITTLLFDIENEPHIVEVGVIESLIKQIKIWGSGVGGQDSYVTTRNTMIFELLITRGLVEFSIRINCFPHNGKVYDFVKDGEIVRKSEYDLLSGISYS